MGAGMAGLATALALRNSGREVVVLERDDEPDKIAPETAFEAWKRPGVPQFHHTHLFLARIRTILRERHAEFLTCLENAGIEPATLDQVLPPSQAAQYVPDPDDERSRHLWGRRATFESALRQYVGGMAGVRFVHSAKIEGLVVEPAGSGVVVRGVAFRRGGKVETLTGDVVVDATGVRSKCVDWLRERGAVIRTESNPSAVGYYCRHYVENGPRTQRRGAGGILDYMIFGTFYAEHRTFSIAFACPESEPELAEFVRKPGGFDHVCGQIPLLSQLTRSATPISRVLGGAGLVNRWHRYATKGSGVALGFFPVGDSHVQTNPIYGRGCSMAFVQAHALADVLARASDPAERARRYHAEARRHLRHYFELSKSADHAIEVRARLSRGEAVPLGDRFVKYVFDEALSPALDADGELAREWIRAQQMREPSSPWVALGMLVRVILHWFARRLRPSLHKPLPAFGPTRAELMASIRSAGSGGTGAEAETAPAE
jgi:2-polyprenyl-6-methoxyphenol hydroxylase-like FAD-dependent oxidoreductase